MVDRSLIFKYWVEFDEEGEIRSLYRNKYNCDSECKEYIVKLIPISRDPAKELKEASKKMARQVNKANKKLNTELNKALKDFKGVMK